ncbi:tetratricopeptide repeat protein [Thalassoroseus pseudoceratinae]|uniref:tetratricopeptide repeat protein n=1 Tax=Thalassoroseus pseudoceratinae TaxID=2713176 RepID=UPI0014244DCE|nr:tetratricopeptide repeat protein [Thalassoroseus pseudoceratinae]
MSQDPPIPDLQDSQPDVSATGRLGRFSHMQIGAAATGLILALAGVFWVMTRPPELTPEQKLEQALIWLEEDTANADRKAKAYAKALQQTEFRDPDFPGAPEYILGMVAFRDALRQHETNRQRLFEQSAHWLEMSEGISLPDDYRPDWCYATGTAFHQIGYPNQAQTLLEEALVINPKVKDDVAWQLIEMALASQDPSELTQALSLSDTLIASLADQTDESDVLKRARLQKARVLLALDQKNEASTLIDEEIADLEDPLTQLIRIQIDIAAGDDQSLSLAKSSLQQLVDSRATDSKTNRSAQLLLGYCYELLDETLYAIDVFEKIARQYPESQEGLAAQFHVAELLQQTDRHEEALLYFQTALDKIKHPSRFRNEWLNVDSIRKRTLKAWNSWIDSSRFEEALSLSQALVPLFTTTEAFELKARATQQWAGSIEKEIAKLPINERESHQSMLESRWRDSGDAFAELAEQLIASSKYGDALWKSADHYRRGRDYASAERILETFLGTQPDRLLPLAHVWKGQALLCLDRAPEALEHFARVLNFHSTDPAAFEAAYWIGLCYLENGDVAKAEQAWRTVLNSDELTPDAEEWRLSLFQLGRLLYETSPLPTADLLVGQDEVEQQSSDSVGPPIARLSEAARFLDEYLKRYPTSSEALEVQSHYAKTHLRIANLRNSQLTATSIDAEQRTLQAERQRHLALSKQLLVNLRQRLKAKKDATGLSEVHRHILIDSEFSLGEVELDLREYAQAIETLNRAVNEYPTTPRIFTAYLQIATAYDELGKPDQAQSMLQQAKVILQRMPEEAFEITSTNFRSRGEWMEWIDWALQVRLRVTQN